MGDGSFGPYYANLFTEYSSVSIPQVAASNEYYAQFFGPEHDFRTDSDWSYRVIKAVIEPTLMQSIQPKYDEFPPMQQGGPLLLALALKAIAHSNDAMVRNLHNQLKRFKISEIPGENIAQVKALVKSIVERICSALNGEFPDQFPQTILALLQTSSVTIFNEHFHQELLNEMKRVATRFAREAKGLPVDDDPASDMERIIGWLDLADQLYEGYVANNEWTPKNVKNSTSKAFNATGKHYRGKPPCFNCKQPVALLIHAISLLTKKKLPRIGKHSLTNTPAGEILASTERTSKNRRRRIGSGVHRRNLKMASA